MKILVKILYFRDSIHSELGKQSCSLILNTNTWEAYWKQTRQDTMITEKLKV